MGACKGGRPRDLQFRFFQPAPRLLQRALTAAYESDITVYDAAFVALGAEPGCPGVTADAKLAERVGAPAARLLSEISEELAG